MRRYVLDTNIISLLMRKDVSVSRQMQQIQMTNHLILGCPLVWYESHRGLLAKKAFNQIKQLEYIFDRFTWEDYTRDDWLVATMWWAKLRTTGVQITDADLMIAIFAHRRNAILVTDNEKDFNALEIKTINWKNP